MTHFRFTLMFATTFVAALGAEPKISIQPLTAKPGDSLNLVVSSEPCATAFDKEMFRVSGADVAFDKDKIEVTNCSMTVPLKVAAKPSSRTARVAIQKAGTPVEELATATLSIVDVPPGPIPPGIDPQVDVLWSVLSESACSDQFGLRLARRFFCVDVQLGNNSGYPIILAGVGFLRRGYRIEYREGTASYLTVRSTVQREQVVSGRNITLRALQAVGVTVAGFTPFSGNAGRRGRIGIWSTLAGTVLATAYDGLIPDRTVRQASNLDDAALRDGKLIPNNSPTRFMVFVDRESIRPLLARSTGELEAEKAQVDSDRNAIAARTDARAEARKAEYTAQSAALELQKNKGASQMKKSINPLGRRYAELEKDLVAVRLALGSLIIVGDQIEYKQRIQVDSGAVNPEIQPSPQVRGVEGSLERDKAVNLVVLGKNLQKAVVSLLDCPTSTFTKEVDAAGSFISLKAFTVPAGCTESVIRMVINTGGGDPVTVSVPVKLQAPTIAIDGAASGPAAADGTLTINLTGTFLAGATTSVAQGTTAVPSKAQGVTVTKMSVVIAKADVPNPAPFPAAGVALTVKVKTTGGDSGTVTFTLTK